MALGVKNVLEPLRPDPFDFFLGVADVRHVVRVVTGREAIRAVCAAFCRIDGHGPALCLQRRRAAGGFGSSMPCRSGHRRAHNPTGWKSRRCIRNCLLVGRHWSDLPGDDVAIPAGGLHSHIIVATVAEPVLVGVTLQAVAGQAHLEHLPVFGRIGARSLPGPRCRAMPSEASCGFPA